MKTRGKVIVGALIVLLAGLISRAEVKAIVERNQGEQATGAFKFKKVPAPSTNDAATKAKFEIVEGDQDQAGGDLDKLHDGKLPTEEDQPAENFFFAQNADGGRILIDLDQPTEIKQVNTYSWHTDTRAPQVYKLYASDGKSGEFEPKPKREKDPEKVGWKLIASVDTRPKDGAPGGQYGVSVSDSEGALGKYRYLLFDIHRTESDDPFGNTFYSEIDVVNKEAAVSEAPSDQELKRVLHFAGKYEVTIDYSQMPQFKDWVNDKLAPVVEEWYPKIVKMLPSEGFEAPTKFSITFLKNGRGVAATGGTRITGAGNWFSHNLDGEAVGALVHEMVHVAQQYGRTRRNNRDAQIPGWLVEGIPDYIRWFLYEPQSHGADHVRNLENAKYNAAYRISANFLDFVTRKYDKDLVPQLNEAIRVGKYNDDLWKQLTGKPVAELADEWKDALKRGNGVAIVEDSARPVADDSSTSSLTEDEKKAGWKLLFEGKTLDGWHTFKMKGVKPGWQVKDGTIACIDPHNAGDLCTNDKYDWFELQLDYNISVGGNSGILYHVTDAGGATWATGPECQLLDNKEGHDGPDYDKRQLSGWLYALYKPPVDPKTDKPLDATKPAGEWNHIRLLISPDKCEHEMNGVKYFEYVIGSDDFKDHVMKSKFGTMKNFAKFDSGYIALQGDHGQVSFRNIKIRPIEKK